MANATLKINNSNGFSNDIWQYEANFTAKQWKEAMNDFGCVVAHAREVLEKLADEDVQDEFLDDEIYQLGDIINFFDSIDVELFAEPEEEEE